MIADLLHAGHINVLKEAAKYGEVTVWVLTSTAINELNDTVYLKYQQRSDVIKNLTMVANVIPQEDASYKTNITKIKPDCVVHGDDWKNIYDVNVFGLANVTKHAVPIIERSQHIGKIINIASIKGLYSSVGRVAYASSKAAVINLTTGLAKELTPKILVNAVDPGFTST